LHGGDQEKKAWDGRVRYSWWGGAGGGGPAPEGPPTQPCSFKGGRGQNREVSKKKKNKLVVTKAPHVWTAIFSPLWGKVGAGFQLSRGGEQQPRGGFPGPPGNTGPGLFPAVSTPHFWANAFFKVPVIWKTNRGVKKQFCLIFSFDFFFFQAGGAGAGAVPKGPDRKNFPANPLRKGEPGKNPNSRTFFSLPPSLFSLVGPRSRKNVPLCRTNFAVGEVPLPGRGGGVLKGFRLREGGGAIQGAKRGGWGGRCFVCRPF